MDENIIEQITEQNTEQETEREPEKKNGRRKTVSMGKGFLAILLIAVLLVGMSAGAWGLYFLGIPGRDSGGNYILTHDEYFSLVEFTERYSKLDYLINYIDCNYYEDVDPDDLLEGAYYGVFDALDDPYSTYMSEEEYSEEIDSYSGEIYGIGVTVTSRDGYIYIIAPSNGGPSFKAGVRAGDYITKVDGVPYSGAELNDAVAHMRGEPGTEVTVTFQRDGVEFEHTLVRQKIVIESVTSRMLSDNIGYIYISSFENPTANQFRQELDKMEKAKVNGLVIDLRSNPGGLVNQATAIADEFLPKCTICTVRDQYGNSEEYTATAGKTGLPVVFLCDSGSASASEIFLCAMKDYNVGKIVGTTTFGKGIIQSVGQEYGDGTAVKLTVLQYFSPTGNEIHKVGVKPDYEVEYPDDLTSDDYDDQGVLKYEKDIQLQKAVDVLKEQLQ